MEKNLEKKVELKSFGSKGYGAITGFLRGFIEVSSTYPTAMRKCLTNKTHDKASLKEKAYDYGVMVPNAPFGPLSVGMWNGLLVYMPLIALCGDQAGRNLLKAQITTNVASLLYEGGRALHKHYKAKNPTPQESF